MANETTNKILNNFKSNLTIDVNKLIDKIENNADMLASLEYLQDDLNNILYTIEKTSTKY